MKTEDSAPSEEEILAGFDSVDAGTVGAEEEFMVLRPGTRELAPEAEKVLARVRGDERYTGELPASQVEARTTPCRTVRELTEQIATARRDLVAAVDGSAGLASAGTHPLAPPRGELSSSPRYDLAIEQYGTGALSRQLVNAFQVHVAPGDAACALGVYNSLRSYLPLLAGIAANAPYLDGMDTGLASIRPQISLLLPRQGVPPALESWAELAHALEWGKASGLMFRSGNWWWELRPRPDLGTLEVRVPDAQTTVRESAAVAALTQCLVMWLAGRHNSGEKLPVHPSWKISENRWLAARDGLEAELADLGTGERRPLREEAGALLESLAGTAAELGCSSELAMVEELLQANGAIRQREAAGNGGLSELPAWLEARFLEGG